MANSWIIQANPDKFRLDEFLRSNPPATSWRVGQTPKTPITPGDVAFVWRARGSAGAHRGIVASATILGTPVPKPAHPNSKPYWVDSANADANVDRVDLIFTRTNGFLAIEHLQHDAILKGVSILKFSQKTFFELKPDEADRLHDLWWGAVR